MKATDKDYALDVIDNIATCTDINDHTGALILLSEFLAEFLNEELRLRLLMQIRREQMERGYINTDCLIERTEIGDKLMLAAESHFRMNDEIDLYTKLREAF